MKNSCKYGYFSTNGREFVITDPRTPRPWINVISNGDYSIIVSQTGGGFSFRNNAEQNRLTRLYMDVVKDNWGKYFYLRDLETGKYFSTTFKPVMEGYDKYEATVGIGYSKFERIQDELKVEQTMFVSADKPLEFVFIKITNQSKRVRKLDLTSYFEWAPGLAYDNHREYWKLFTNIDFDKKLNALIVNKVLYGFLDEKGRGGNDDWPYTAFLACSNPIDSFDADKEAFIGMYNDELTANGMKSEKLSNSQGRFIDPCGATRTLIELKPGETKEIVYTIGMAKKNEENYADFIKFTTPKVIDEELEKVHKFWANLLDKDVCKTGNDEFDFFTNIWSKYQAISGRLWAKAAYYQISGGIGFRDQLQDSLVFLESNPELTKKQIMLHATHQFYKGDVHHWWLTINPWGPRGNCSDDFLWLPLAVSSFIYETGDFSILEEKARYVDNDAQETIYEHIKKAIFRSIELTSSRGVPLMGDHDWNDGLSAVGHGLKGESFWVAEFLYYILTNLKPIIEYKKDAEFLKICEEKQALTKETLNKYGWDGEYFLQATNDEGELIGSHTTEEGKVFLNPQLWAVIADITTEERKQKAMDAVSKYLLRDYGCLLLYPAYTKPNKEIGYVTRYAPGLRENGGVYTHAATWGAWAYSLMGDNERAFESYIRINPIHRLRDIDRFKSEPYVTPGNSDGPISPYFGKGGWSWYSGSAQWMHNVAVKNILGVQGKITGVEIKPCLPKEINEYTYTRKFNKSTLNIHVVKSDKNSLKVNGKLLEGNFVPVSGKEETYNIELTIK